MAGLTTQDKKTRIVVLGAGFGGLAFCQHFRGRIRGRGDVKVVLIDKQNHHLFQPLLYQVAMAGLAAPDIAAPLRTVFRNYPDVSVHMAEVEAIDLKNKTVTAAGRVVSYDYLVIGLGGLTSYFGHDDWAEHALGLKTLDDAMAIRRRILRSFEIAENTDDLDERRRLMTIVVVGGGPTGLELAGTMAELTRRVFRRDFRRINPAEARVVLVEGMHRLLANYPESLSRSAEEQVKELGVEVKTKSMVKQVSEGRVELTTGEVIESRNILWGAGVQAHPLTKTLGVPTDKAGRIEVQPDLSLPGHPEVFAVGDLAVMKQTDGTPVPGVAPAAMQMGRYVARLLSAELAHETGVTKPRSVAPFTYRDKGSMATIGRSRAVAWIGRLKFGGFPAWIAWLTIHLFFLVTFRNKLMVLINWVYAYFTYGRGARIIFGGDRER
jgi:NADH dehydrogenase